ncbi:hypothetical protein ACWC9T_13680 [Kitasatospora sp. NPDC001159]
MRSAPRRRFRAPGAAHQLLVVYTAAPGSRAEEALSLLGTLAAEPAGR